jgi:hypothetical protein
LHIAQRIATNIMLSGMSVFGAIVHRMKLEIIRLLTCNTLGGITTYIVRLVMPTQRHLMSKSRCSMFTEDTTCFDILPAL